MTGSKIRIIWSSLAVARQLPSGAIATDATPPMWPVRVRPRLPHCLCGHRWRGARRHHAGLVRGAQGDYLANAAAIAFSPFATGAFIVGMTAPIGPPGIAVGAIITLLIGNPISAAASRLSSCRNRGARSVSGSCPAHPSRCCAILDLNQCQPLT
jgi:hypothetical protein